MIRTLAVNCAPILDCSQDAGKTVAKTAPDEMAMGAAWALCEFSLLVSQRNHSDLSLSVLDDALKRCYMMKGAFREQKVSKSAKAKVDERLARESHQLREQIIHKIRAAMDSQLYGAEQVTTSKWRQFRLPLNGAWQGATIWLDADRQRAIEQLERGIDHVTPAKRKLLDKSFEHHEQHLLQEVRTKATSPRCTFTKTLAPMKTAAEEVACRAVYMTADKGLQCQVRPSDAETAAATWSITDTDRVVNQLEREMYGITSKDQMRFMKEYCIHLVRFECWWQAIGVQELRKSSNSVYYISKIRRCILWAIYSSQWGEWVPSTISPLIFLHGYISAM